MRRVASLFGSAISGQSLASKEMSTVRGKEMHVSLRAKRLNKHLYTYRVLNLAETSGERSQMHGHIVRKNAARMRCVAILIVEANFCGAQGWKRRERYPKSNHCGSVPSPSSSKRLEGSFPKPAWQRVLHIMHLRHQRGGKEKQLMHLSPSREIPTTSAYLSSLACDGILALCMHLGSWKTEGEASTAHRDESVSSRKGMPKCRTNGLNCRLEAPNCEPPLISQARCACGSPRWVVRCLHTNEVVCREKMAPGLCVFVKAKEFKVP
jgi:hypothetical protein